MEDEYKGKETLLIRLYFYLNNGLGVVNDFRNLFLGLFALYYTLKLQNPWILLGLFLVSLPTLCIMGYVNVHKVSKIKDWLNIKYGSHYGIEQFNLMKKMVELLEKQNENTNKKGD